MWNVDVVAVRNVLKSQKQQSPWSRRQEQKPQQIAIQRAHTHWWRWGQCPCPHSFCRVAFGARRERDLEASVLEAASGVSCSSLSEKEPEASSDEMNLRAVRGMALAVVVGGGAALELVVALIRLILAAKPTQGSH